MKIIVVVGMMRERERGKQYFVLFFKISKFQGDFAFK
jgi:hypothetical protein